MELKEHWLESIPAPGILGKSIQSPNCSPDLDPRWIVMHYTVLEETETVLEWFADPQRQVSAHFVISPHGVIHQCVPCNERAWHAGQSTWDGISGLNAYSIGIELVNGGRLEWRERWETWFGTPVPEAQILRAHHPNTELQDPTSTPDAWQIYPEAQLQSAKTLIKTLCAQYPIEQILGHDEIAPGRKWDPGPALPWDLFRNVDRKPLS
jgi:N-acetylmuramoyl-L-alanine amidase